MKKKRPCNVPRDRRWGSADDVGREFGLAPMTTRALHVAGWVRAVQPTWRDDRHRCQALYCFDDIHRYLLRAAHKVSKEYVRRFWTYDEIPKMVERIGIGPYGRKEAT